MLNLPLPTVKFLAGLTLTKGLQEMSHRTFEAVYKIFIDKDAPALFENGGRVDEKLIFSRD
jgi:hypothetical protein